jgi:uncharacterized membrane protein YbhN (UPF0104 family)
MTPKSAAPPADLPPAPPRWRQALGIAFTVLVLGLVVHLARRMDWGSALLALQQLPATALAAAAAFAALSHVLYCGYDLIGRRQTGHRLATGQVATVGFISYAFNLNLGSLVGGVALRYRLYARLGLSVAVVTQVLAWSMLTNWLGYLLLAGGVLLLAPPAFPPDWGVAAASLPVVGAMLWLAVGGYLLLCAGPRHREWRWRGQRLRLPSLPWALLQLGLASVNWLVIAAIVWCLLQQQVDYAQVLGVLLLAAVAGVVTHVPAGLGVLEAVFLGLLGGRVPAAQLLAVLLAYRTVYYLLPLLLAAGLLVFGQPHKAAVPAE